MKQGSLFDTAVPAHVAAQPRRRMKQGSLFEERPAAQLPPNVCAACGAPATIKITPLSHLEPPTCSRHEVVWRWDPPLSGDEALRLYRRALARRPLFDRFQERRL